MALYLTCYVFFNLNFKLAVSHCCLLRAQKLLLVMSSKQAKQDFRLIVEKFFNR